MMSSNPPCDEALATPHLSKRQRSNKSSSSSKRKKTRSSEEASAVHWKKGLPVWVNCYDGYGNRGWEAGIVDQVEDTAELGQYRIVVHVKDPDDNWVLPRTHKDKNSDAIPSVDPNIPNYKLSDYIRTRNEALDDAPELLIKLYKCIQYHSQRGALNIADKSQEQDAVGKLLLDKDPTSPTAIHNLLHSLMDRDDVKKIVSTVTGSDTVTVQFALAYILGQLCGIEICESGSVDDLDPQQLLKKLGGSNTIDTGQCPISQVFLMSNMTARTKNYKTFDPNGALYHSRRKDAFDDPEKLKTRMKRLQTALAAIHSSQYELPKVSGPSSALLLHGIQLMTDMRGTSDSLLNKLSEDGICRPANVIRVWIQKLADAIEPLTTREPIPRMSHVLCNTADNADFHLFGTCKSVVPGGTILLGIEPEGDSDHLGGMVETLSMTWLETLFVRRYNDTISMG